MENLDFLIKADGNIKKAKIVDVITVKMERSTGLMLTISDNCNENFHVEYEVCLSEKDLKQVLELIKEYKENQ